MDLEVRTSQGHARERERAICDGVAMTGQKTEQQATSTQADCNVRKCEPRFDQSPGRYLILSAHRLAEVVASWPQKAANPQTFSNVQDPRTGANWRDRVRVDRAPKFVGPAATIAGTLTYPPLPRRVDDCCFGIHSSY